MIDNPEKAAEGMQRKLKARAGKSSRKRKETEPRGPHAAKAKAPWQAAKSIDGSERG